MSIISTEQRKIAIPRAQLSGLTRETRRRIMVIAGRVLLLVIACLIWEFAARERWMNPVFIGRPSQIIVDYGRALAGSVLMVDARATVVATLLGFALATIAGIVSAMILTQITILDEIVQPFFTALNSMPRVALAPLFVMWFGVGALSKVALSASLVFFVVLLNTMAGIQSVDRDHITLARTLGASPLAIFLKIKLPSAVPSIFAGIELGMIYGFLGTVAGEMLAGDQGIGVRLQEYSGLFKTNEFFAALLLLVTITTAISLGLRAVRRRLLRWQNMGVGKTES
jgi:NitT/TauT family transport system permease protein